MKKVLIAREVHDLLEREKTLLNRADIKVFVAATNDEVFAIHRAQRVDLIITSLDLPGLAGDELSSRIREDPDLRAVSIIMISENTPAAIARSKECRANAVLLRPVHPLLIMVKAQQLLEIAARETVRVFLSAKVEGNARDELFYCRTRDISVTGMLIETDRELTEGTRLSCLLYLPDTKKIRLAGKIIRILERSPDDEDYRYGFMFTEISAEARQQLAAFVDEIVRESETGRR